MRFIEQRTVTSLAVITALTLFILTKHLTVRLVESILWRRSTSDTRPGRRWDAANASTFYPHGNATNAVPTGIEPNPIIEIGPVSWLIVKLIPDRAVPHLSDNDIEDIIHNRAIRITITVMLIIIGIQIARPILEILCHVL